MLKQTSNSCGKVSSVAYRLGLWPTNAFSPPNTKDIEYTQTNVNVLCVSNNPWDYTQSTHSFTAMTLHEFTHSNLLTLVSQKRKQGGGVGGTKQPEQKNKRNFILIFPSINIFLSPFITFTICSTVELLLLV